MVCRFPYSSPNLVFNYDRVFLAFCTFLHNFQNFFSLMIFKVLTVLTEILFLYKHGNQLWAYPVIQSSGKEQRSGYQKRKSVQKREKSRMAFLFCSPFNESNLIHSFKQNKNKILPEEKGNSFSTCLQRKMMPMLSCFWITQHTKGFKGLSQTWSCKTVQENKPALKLLSRKDRITVIFFLYLFYLEWNHKPWFALFTHPYMQTFLILD